MQLHTLRILLLVSPLFFAAAGVAQARSTGQALPELSGRSIGPGDDPRVQRRIRLKRQAQKRGRRHEVRKRSRTRYRSVRLKGGGWRFYGAGWSADVAVDGTLSFDKRTATWSTRKMQLSFDITDAVMRAKGKDPYAAAKLRFMRETAAWRGTLGRAARRKARRLYFEQLPGRLRALWKRSDITVMRKRWLLFELWEECLEPGPATDRVKAQQARWMILRFIQKHLPAAGPGAYTRRELRRITKRRRGRFAFDPYGRLKRPKPIDVPGR